MILGYGFSIADNPADHCGLTLLSGARQSQDPVDQPCGRQLEDPKTSLEAELKSRREPVQWVRLRNSIVDKISCHEKPSFEFSPGFLNKIGTALSNQREKDNPNPYLREQVDFSSVDLSRIQLKMMATVVMVLQRQYSKIVEHSLSLPQWPENEKQFHAARYRRGQLHILRSVNASLLGTLSRLVGFNDSVTRDTRIMRLEHMLAESPSPLLIDFRAALNAGLGTRKAAKIRDRGWVECVFTLWVCGVWLWEQMFSSDNDSSTKSDLKIRICQWLHFLHDTYTDVPIQHSSSANHDGLGSSPVATDEDMLLVDSYLQLIKAAVQKNPRSLFNNCSCTSSRLLWCLNIVRKESVMCPSFEGKTGDENDELVLFLETRAKG